MTNFDILYNQPHLIEIDPYQFKNFLFCFARNKQQFPEYMMTATDTSDKRNIVLVDGDRCVLFCPTLFDPIFYAPKIDTDLWEFFKKIDPVGAEPVL